MVPQKPGDGGAVVPCSWMMITSRTTTAFMVDPDAELSEALYLMDR